MSVPAFDLLNETPRHQDTKEIQPGTASAAKQSALFNSDISGLSRFARLNGSLVPWRLGVSPFLKLPKTAKSTSVV